MKSLFLRALTVLLFVSFVLPEAYELSSQQVPKNKNSKVQQKDRQRLRDGSCNGTFKRKHKRINKHKKTKKFKHKRGRW